METKLTSFDFSKLGESLDHFGEVARKTRLELERAGVTPKRQPHWITEPKRHRSYK